MATFADNLKQQTNEIHTYTVDFSNDLPSGGTVTAGTATHTPPSGAASTITITVSSPLVYATLPVQAVTGIHFLDVVATFNNGDKSSARIPITVVYPTPTARVGMLSLIAELRGMAEVGPADYEVGGNPYWQDAQIQDVLDLHREDLVFEPLAIYPVQAAGGSLQWKDYRSERSFFEQSAGGTSILYIQDSTGATIPSSAYTPDYRRGQFQFAADTFGSSLYLTGRSYDLHAAAADLWRRKASHYATAFDFSTDNHSVSRSQVYQHCLEMAKFYDTLSAQAVQVADLFRSDLNEGEESDDAV